MILKLHHQAVLFSLQGHSHGSCILGGREEIKSNSVPSLSNIRFIHKLICMRESESVSPNPCLWILVPYQLDRAGKKFHVS